MAEAGTAVGMPATRGDLMSSRVSLPAARRLRMQRRLRQQSEQDWPLRQLQLSVGQTTATGWAAM